MHFHVPKPLHGWREFAGEVGIIVLGVLIALGAEQLISSIHDRQQVRQGEDSLRDNFERFITFTAELDAYAPCVAARATELRGLIDRSAAAHRLPRVGAIPQLTPHPWQIDTYSAMVASQAITHVSHSQAILYSRVAMSAIDLYDDGKVEWSDWGVLESLTGNSRSYGEAEEAQDRMVLARAVHQDSMMRVIADNTADRIRRTGLLDRQEWDAAVQDGRRTAATIPMCSPIEIAS